MATSRRWIGWTVLLLLAITAIAVPIALHVSQKRHNELPDIVARFPDTQPLVGGEVFATTLADLMDHELNGRTGWRPNDFVLWGPQLWADNNANRQLGILQVVRESTRVLKDHLTKVSSDQYDPNLLAADTAFRNDPKRLWLPSAESKYRDGVAKLRAYVAGLATTPPTSKPLTQRNVEVIRLFQTWGDILGDAHAQLFRTEIPRFGTDDVFYYVQGEAYAMAHLVRAVEREYRDDLKGRQTLNTLLAEVSDALTRAGRLKPLVVFDGDADGLFANHRRNLDTYVTEARQKMYSIREELEK